MYSSRTEANRAVFDDFAKPRILKQGRQNLKHIYNKFFLPNFLKLMLPYEPISEKTFYVYDKKYIDPSDRIRAQQGRVALKHAKICKTKKFQGDGFCSLVEVDSYHEPIALLDPITFKPTNVRPIHHLAFEVHTGNYVATVTDYVNGSELSSYIIELYKKMFFPKPGFQATYGSEYPFFPYCKPYLIFHDGGGAYISKLNRVFLALANTCSGLAKTQDAKGKAFIESGNFSIKTGFTWTLPGHYDDNQKTYIDPKPYSKSAVLTTLEHEVLFNRFICDTHNNGYDKRRKFNRGEQWIREAAAFPPPRPSNPKDILSFMGMKDKKTIQKAVGIQFHVRGRTHTFNSEVLQNLRLLLIQSHQELKVSYHRSDFFPDFIRVVNPLADEVISIPRIIEDEDTEIIYVGDEEFYTELRALQQIEILAAMTSDEIVDTAEKRKRKIQRYESDKKRQFAHDSKDTVDTVNEDLEIVKKAIADIAADEIDIEEITNDDTNDKSTDQHNEAPEDKDDNNTDNAFSDWGELDDNE
jgi:hypothetical protein